MLHMELLAKERTCHLWWSELQAQLLGAFLGAPFAHRSCSGWSHPPQQLPKTHACPRWPSPSGTCSYVLLRNSCKMALASSRTVFMTLSRLETVSLQVRSAAVIFVSSIHVSCRGCGCFGSLGSGPPSQNPGSKGGSSYQDHKKASYQKAPRPFRMRIPPHRFRLALLHCLPQETNAETGYNPNALHAATWAGPGCWEMSWK